MDLMQPRDPKHPIYRIIDEYLEPGDQKAIWQELNVSQRSVSLVKRGKSRSKRIWKRIIEMVLWRKEQRIQMAKDLNAIKDEAAKQFGPPHGGSKVWRKYHSNRHL